MSRENVEIMREMFALVNERGVQAATEAFGDLLDPEFELQEASKSPTARSIRGGMRSSPTWRSWKRASRS
jgi:hypothetical protein